MELNLKVRVRKEGGWFVISDDKYGITTQGRTMKEAILNFHDAFSICFEDSDWREIHGLPALTPAPGNMEVNPLAQVAACFGPKIDPRLVQSAGILC